MMGHINGGKQKYIKINKYTKKVNMLLNYEIVFKYLRSQSFTIFYFFSIKIMIRLTIQIFSDSCSSSSQVFNKIMGFVFFSNSNIIHTFKLVVIFLFIFTIKDVFHCLPSPVVVIAVGESEE